MEDKKETPEPNKTPEEEAKAQKRARKKRTFQSPGVEKRG